MTQWVSFAAYDESDAKPGLKFWDTQAKPPAPPAPKAAAPSVRPWTTAGQESLAQLAHAHGAGASTVLRMTAQHSPGAEFPPAVATYLDAVFAGTADPSKPMPAGLTLFLPA
jgi:hypothetical protein